MMKRYLLVSWFALFLTGNLLANDFHPEVPLLDAAGELLAETGLPLSTMQTCGACHDTTFIAESSDHAVAGVFDEGEIDCLICHSDAGDRRTWTADMFRPDGVLNENAFDIHKPTDENCAQCHSIVSNELDEPLTIPARSETFSMTDLTGQIISPQKISNSGLNIAGKDSLNHPFDIHSDRVVGCVNCHYSLNNPVYFQQRKESRPAHLEFDPRRLTSADYLERPLHQLAKGSSTHGLHSVESNNSMRRCESCHKAEDVHEWLPYKKRHFASLACESCHIPKLYGPALQAIDWTLVNRDGQPIRQYRNVAGDPATADSLINGFEPLIMPREHVGGERKLAPFNLVSIWYWMAGEPVLRVTQDQLVAALYVNGRLHPEIAKVLGSELRIDSPEQADVVRQRLRATGLVNVHMVSEIQSYSISHDVVNGERATRDCTSCHGGDSVLAAAFTLSDYLPGGMLPAAGDTSSALGGHIAGGPDGGAHFVTNSSDTGYYIIGLDGLDWVDALGLLMFLGISLGVTVHAIGRFIANRRRPHQHGATRRVYMYDAYERIWHWLQASAILLLIFTGLIIHKPQIFGMFSFAYVVQVHNVLGFILLINAALALFYTVASGTIRRFLPEPNDFFGRAIAQAMYYSRGIFAGERHPLEKTKENRLNPLQQITYLAILNILLPAQVITGVIIWGMQKWPHLAAALGGLPVLAPIHTLVAWAFAAFIVMHVYLTTAAGETPGAGIKSMISGWEGVEEHAKETVNE